MIFKRKFCKMIKNSKKFLALSLSLISLVSSMGSFNVYAGKNHPKHVRRRIGSKTSERCTGSKTPERCTPNRVSPMGLTPEDLEGELIQRIFSIYTELEKELTFVLGESKKVGEYSSLSDCYKKDTVYTLRNHTGNCRMISNRFIFEFLKRRLNKTDGFVKISPLTIVFANKTVHIAVALVTTKKVYIIDLSSDLQDRSEHKMPLPVPYIFSAQKYMEYMNCISLSNPIFFGVIEEDISTCTKRDTERFSTPLEMVCQASDLLSNRGKEMSMPSSLEGSLDECMSTLEYSSSEKKNFRRMHEYFRTFV